MIGHIFSLLRVIKTSDKVSGEPRTQIQTEAEAEAEIDSETQERLEEGLVKRPALTGTQTQRLQTQRLIASAYLRHYIHPLKVALITTLASLLVISPTLHDLFPYGLWGSIVVILIRQDSSASSFHKGYQRVEGTLLGCLFAFSMSRMFNCTSTGGEADTPCAEKNPALLLMLLVCWIGLCSFYREHEQHGYAALVAGFTPIVVSISHKK